MTLEIRGRGARIRGPERDHIERRFRFALARFGDRIGRVAVYLADVNGPRGGRDIRCRAVVQLPPGGCVTIEVEDEALAAAVDRVADRAGHAVGRELDRRRDRRGALSASGQPT